MFRFYEYQETYFDKVKPTKQVYVLYWRLILNIVYKKVKLINNDIAFVKFP